MWGEANHGLTHDICSCVKTLNCETMVGMLAQVIILVVRFVGTIGVVPFKVNRTLVVILLISPSMRYKFIQDAMAIKCELILSIRRISEERRIPPGTTINKSFNK
jgi:hypothetical protein